MSFIILFKKTKTKKLMIKSVKRVALLFYLFYPVTNKHRSIISFHSFILTGLISKKENTKTFIWILFKCYIYFVFFWNQWVGGLSNIIHRKKNIIPKKSHLDIYGNCFVVSSTIQNHDIRIQQRHRQTNKQTKVKFIHNTHTQIVSKDNNKSKSRLTEKRQ